MKDRISLSRVKIEGFKSYGTLLKDGITLNDINVIIGANGAGKSNFISFLEMIAYIASDGFGNYLGKNGFADSILHFGSKETQSVLGEIQLSVGTKMDRYSFKLSSSVGGKMYFERETVAYESPEFANPYEKLFGVSVEKSNLIDWSKENATGKALLSLMRGFRIFHFNDTSVNSGMRSPTYLEDNTYLRSDAGNISAFLLKMKNEYDDYYIRITDVIREVFPRFGEFVLNPIHYDNSDDRILLNWKERGSEVIFGPHMLSDGTLRLIALVSLLLQPEETMPGVIIMDEPEIGMHPYAIQILSELIRKASIRAQIILTTQSAALLDCFGEEHAIIAEYDNKARSSWLHRLDTDKLGEWIKDYSLGELWEKNVFGGVPVQ